MGTATTLNQTPADADARIYNPLDQLKGTIRKFVVLDGVLAAALFLTGWFWVGLALDFGVFKLTSFDWVQDAPWGLRAVGLLFVVLAVAVILVTRIVFRLRTEFSYPSLALVLEKRFPDLLGDRLITAVELADVNRMVKYGYSADMIHQTIRDARERVGQIPLSGVFNWRRLQTKAALVVAVAVVLAGASFGLQAAFGTPGAPGGFAGQFYDTAMIWTERNVFLRNTPWPRRAHLEVVEPNVEEYRIGKDAAAPTIRVRASKWVVADRGTWAGWRPAKWSDLAAVTGIEPTALAAVVPKTAPNHVALTSAGADPTADEVEAVGFEEGSEGYAVFKQLDEVAGRGSMTRTFRKLVVPTETTLTYTGQRTSGAVTLTREPSGDFTGTVAGLKESVTYVVKGEDFVTPPRQVTLVPPPLLTKLMRTEYRPAYEYHPAPWENIAPPGSKDNFIANWDGIKNEKGEIVRPGLKGLRQVFRDKELSLTGDKSVFTVPVGTELEITGVADKPLKSAFLTVKVGKVLDGGPGATRPVAVADDRFTIPLRGPHAVAANAEFEVTMVDFDNVSATKTLLVQATEDRAPEVEIAVDVLRKAASGGNVYLCTPMARVPFLADSVVRDDKGLSRVEYEYTRSKLESSSTLELQVKALAGVWASAPVGPDTGLLFASFARGQLANSLVKPDSLTKTMPVTRFTELYGALPRDTPERLASKLTQPIDEDRPGAVKAVKFSDPNTDSFELDKALPEIRVSDATEVQPRYRVDVNVVATDTNVEAGRKSSRSVEPVRLLVISEEDLLAEMSKDQGKLIAQLDDILKKIDEARRKLRDTTSWMASPQPTPQKILDARVRTEDASQDVGKAKEITQGVLRDYKNLQREAQVNRCNAKYIERLDTVVISPLTAVVDKNFADSERAMGNVQSALAESGRPTDAQLASAANELTLLFDAIRRIRDSEGEGFTIDNLRIQLQAVITKQREVSATLKFQQQRLQGLLFLPAIASLPPVTLNKGETKTLRHAIDWKVYDKDELPVTIAAEAGSDFTVTPAKLAVPVDEKSAVEYAVTAGQKAGTFTVTVTPAVGLTVRVQVTVK